MKNVRKCFLVSCLIPRLLCLHYVKDLTLFDISRTVNRANVRESSKFLKVKIENKESLLYIRSKTFMLNDNSKRNLYNDDVSFHRIKLNKRICCTCLIYLQIIIIHHIGKRHLDFIRCVDKCACAYVNVCV